MSTLKSALLWGLMASTAGIPAVAHGQDTGASPDSGAGLGEIIVTATRRSESLQDVPMSIAAVTGDQLGSAGVNTTRGLEQVVPGLVFGTTATSSQPTLRGIGTRNAAPNDESNIAMYLDGVYQPAMASNNFELLNVERVEVLKGPQGTLYGRNATGGAINIVTSKPGDQLAGRFSLSFGRYNEINAKGYVSAPLGEIAAVDVAFNRGYREGYVDDLVRGGKLGDRRTTNVRSRVRVRPSDAIDIIAAVSYTRTADSSNFTVQPINGNSVGRALNPNVLLPTKSRQYVGDILPKSGYRQRDYNLQADFDLGFASLQSVTDYQKNSTYYRSDSDGTVVSGRWLEGLDDFSKAWTQEVRLVSQGTGPLQWIVGAMTFGSKSGLNPLNIYTPGRVTVVKGRQKATAYAGYAEATYNVLDGLFVTGGVRYSWEKRTFTPNVGTPGPRAHVSFDDWTPHASVRYEISPEANLFLTYSEGFKSGLYNISAASVTPIRPETIKAIEGGVKLQPLPILRANLSAFTYDYKDLQVSARLAGNTTSFLQNAGKARIRGVDFDMTAAPAEGLSMTFAAAYLHAKFKDFQGAAVNVPTLVNGVAVGGNTPIIADVSGNTLIRAPKLTLTAGVNYEVPLAGGILKLGANANYNDGYFLEFGNRLRQPSYTLVNANIGLWTADERFGVTLWGENLTDEDVIQYALISANQDGYSYRLPAMYGIRLEGRF